MSALLQRAASSPDAAILPCTPSTPCGRVGHGYWQKYCHETVVDRLRPLQISPTRSVNKHRFVHSLDASVLFSVKDLF